LVWFSGQTSAFDLVYSRTKTFRLTRPGQNQAKRLRPCLACNVFIEGFFGFKGVFGKHSLVPILIVLVLRKIGFCQTKPK
jgi:hypothetical protein